MIKFTTVALHDRDWMDKLIRSENTRNADCNFTNIYIWNETFHQKVTPLYGRLAIKLFYQNSPFYAFPVGNGDLKKSVLALAEDAATHDIKLKIRGITKESLMELESVFPDVFEIGMDTYASDYIYTVEKMATLAGKKLHSKRNHINRFIESNDWSFEPISEDNLDECMDMCVRWMQLNLGKSNYDNERMALNRAFRSYDKLELEGGLLRSSGEVIAFTMGEPLCSDTYVIHFEKAFTHIQGAYTMINREFARYIQARHPEILYINREDDMGIESLQKAKRSYYPEFMVDKFTATWK